MRQIEQQMLQAFAEHRQHWKRDNTQLDTITSGHCQVITIHLFGNLIACFNTGNQILSFNNAGWPSKTTHNRLNALLDLAPYPIGISMDRFIPYINTPLQRLPMQPEQWYTAPLRRELSSPGPLPPLTHRHDDLFFYSDPHGLVCEATERLPELVR